MDAPLRFVVVGPGRAGESFRRALTTVGAVCIDTISRDDAPERIDPTADLVLIAVPDRAIREVADRIPAGPLVAHVSGATTLAPLQPRHERCGSIHPLLSLPDGDTGAAALLAGSNLAIAGSDDTVRSELVAIAELLGAQHFVVDDADRSAYHAAAAIAANHLVALAAQVDRVTSARALPLGPFLDMMRAVLDNVEANGSAAALTGPVARADWATVAIHLDAVGPAERPLYLCLAESCATLAGVELPADLRLDHASAAAAPPPAASSQEST